MVSDDLKSIAQLAAEIGVSRQAVYNKLNGKELFEAVKPHVVRHGNANLYTLQGQALIRASFEASVSSDIQSELTEIKAKFESVSNELTACKEQLESAIHDIEAKTAELQRKEQTLNELTSKLKVLESESKLNDQTIERLEQDKQQLNERLDKAEEDRTQLINSQNELTIALKAAQALHGMDKQQTAIEAPAAESAPKKSFFARLFRR